jgi:L-2-hydroxyglutarate oxidase LhgO
MEQVNILIIGAGVVGLSIGKYLTEEHSDVVIVEKESSFGRETSSRNSEVIHSGIYYPHGSLKAKLCVEGNRMLYDYAAEKKIGCRRTGKIVIAGEESEYPELEKLYRHGQANGVEGLQLITGNRLQELEPLIIAGKGLWVPSTGIIDTHNLMLNLANEIESDDGFIVYGMEAEKIEKNETGYLVSFNNGEEFQTNILINAAGLFSDKIASLAGIDLKDTNLKLHWCKGEYYKASGVGEISRLIYPLPDPKGISLGIHLTVNLNGEIRFGPNAYYVEELNYAMDESHKADFMKAVNRYLPIEMHNLHPDDTGIRPKLQGPGENVRDFYIKEEAERGLKNLINLIGIESPGLTACLAIGRYVRDLIGKRVHADSAV